MWGEVALLGGFAQLGDKIFVQRSYGISYLTSFKQFVISLEKDWFDHVVFKWI